jgi:hypothetical protein
MSDTLMTEKLNVKDVMSVYSGKNRKCCCGCAGKHSYASQYADVGSANRGYPVTADDINNAQVTRIVNIIKKHAIDSDWYGDEHVAVIIGARLYIAYIATAEKIQKARG